MGWAGGPGGKASAKLRRPEHRGFGDRNKLSSPGGRSERGRAGLWKERGSKLDSSYSCLKNPMDEKPGGLQSIGLQRVGHY